MSHLAGVQDFTSHYSSNVLQCIHIVAVYKPESISPSSCAVLIRVDGHCSPSHTSLESSLSSRYFMHAIIFFFFFFKNQDIVLHPLKLSFLCSPHAYTCNFVSSWTRPLFDNVSVSYDYTTKPVSKFDAHQLHGRNCPFGFQTKSQTGLVWSLLTNQSGPLELERLHPRSRLRKFMRRSGSGSGRQCLPMWLIAPESFMVVCKICLFSATIVARVLLSGSAVSVININTCLVVLFSAPF